jgi:protein TonB
MRRMTLRPARSSRRPKSRRPSPRRPSRNSRKRSKCRPPPQELKPERPKPKPLPPVPTTTAPQRQRTASLTVVNSWHSRIVGLIERNKAYPPAAQARGETGVVQLAFSIDRQGHVLASQVVRSSGHAALDQETLATVRRAQPFPPPPVDLPGAKFDFTVPVRFNIR